MKQIKGKPLPQHVAVILDGNRRWARKRGLPPWLGHEKGAQKVEELLDWCLELGIKTITIFAFSTENFQRNSREVNELFKIFHKYLSKAINDERIHRYGVHVKAIGRVHLLPPYLQQVIKELEEKTKNYSNYYLNIAIAYGGRAEIVDAVKKICRDVLKGKLDVDSIDEDTIKKYLYTAHLPNPEPDLVIRTSGEERISNFLLFQIAYSELVFLDVYWPEFRKIDFLRAIRTYQQRQRRFGR